jgi:uncharacterized protein YecE (DUF72 family)
MVRIGCSGWQYAAWRGRFYASDLRPAQWFEHYATVFDTVEVNNTFYRLPESEVFARWRRMAPAGFLFAVKASRFLTHLKRLSSPEEPLERLLTRAAALGPALGPVLYQLPPTLAKDLPRLEAFLAALTRVSRRIGRRRRTLAPIRHVLEFRDPSWYDRDVFERLDAHGIACCVHDRAGSQAPWQDAGPFTYVRFHGASGHYAGEYGEAGLAPWLDRIAAAAQTGRSVYVYFNNDPDAAAPRDAARLKTMLESRIVAQDDEVSRWQDDRHARSGTRSLGSAT